MKHFAWIVLGITLILGCGSTGPQRDTLQFVSVEEELSLGRSLSLQASKQLKLIRNQQVNAFLNKLASEIGAQSDWDGLTYNVYLVNDSHLNHFSLPGGHIYLFRGIVDLAENTSEVAAIIAHEIAHLASRDGVDKVAVKYAYAFAAQSVLGEIEEIPQQIISNLYSDGTILDYSEEDEYFADERCVKYLWKANYDPAGFVSMLEKLRTAQEENPESVLLLQSTHPPISKRYKKVVNNVRRTPHKRSLRKNTPEFDAIKATLSQIPR